VCVCVGGETRWSDITAGAASCGGCRCSCRWCCRWAVADVAENGTWLTVLIGGLIESLSVCCSVLQRVTACCICCSELHIQYSCRYWLVSALRLRAACCLCVSVCCSVLQCVAVCCSVLQWVGAQYMFCMCVRPTQSIIYVPLLVCVFHKSILLIVQYKYFKSYSKDFKLQNLILRTQLCVTGFSPQQSWILNIVESLISTLPKWSGGNVLYQAWTSSERANRQGWSLNAFTWFIGAGGIWHRQRERENESTRARATNSN